MAATQSHPVGLLAVDQNIKESFVCDLQDNYEATIANLEAINSSLPDSPHTAVAHTVKQLQDHFDDVMTTFFPDREYAPLTWNETAHISETDRADSAIALSTKGSISPTQLEGDMMR